MSPTRSRRTTSLEGALELAASYRFFPAGTIFVAVVDPGVGSSRRGIAAEIGDYRFVCPDNGLLTAVARDAPAKKIVELTERRYARPTVEPHVRGARPVRTGGRMDGQGHPAGGARPQPVRLPSARHPAARRGRRRLSGAVLRIDRFGNLVTNIDRKTFEKFGREGGWQIAAGGATVGRLVATYADMQSGEVCALFGSTDHLDWRPTPETRRRCSA